MHLCIGNVNSNLEKLYFHLNFEYKLLTLALSKGPHTPCTLQVSAFNSDSDQTKDGRQFTDENRFIHISADTYSISGIKEVALL